MYASANGASDEDDLCTQISAEVLQLLHAHLMNFLTDLIHRSIVLREEEIKLKERTKVWRMSERTVGVLKHLGTVTCQQLFIQIKIATIDQALEIMGAVRKKNPYFAMYTKIFKSTLEEMSSQQRSSIEQGKEHGAKGATRPISSEDDSGTEPDDDEIVMANTIQDASSSIPSFSIHRDLNVPFITHPSVDALESYAPQSSSLSQRDTADDLMQDRTDENELLEELIEEDALDALDREMDAKEMAALWGTFGRDEHGQLICDKDVDGQEDGGDDDEGEAEHVHDDDMDSRRHENGKKRYGLRPRPRRAERRVKSRLNEEESD